MEAGAGVRYPHREIPGLRRYLLRATRYHLYFVYTDEHVVIVAIWGATRGTPPRLSDRISSTKRALAGGGLETRTVGSDSSGVVFTILPTIRARRALPHSEKRDALELVVVVLVPSHVSTGHRFLAGRRIASAGGRPVPVNDSETALARN